LAAFSVMPAGLTVEVLDKDEQILLLVRRHIITNIRWVLISLAMAIAPVFAGILPLFDMLPSRFIFATIILWYLLVVAVILEGFLNWYFDMFVVTDERIIDIDFENLIYRNITSTKIDRIEDVTYNVSGAIPSFFRYGNVLIQTAGAGVVKDNQDTSAQIEICKTPHPSKVAKLVNELILEEEQEKLEGRVK
jgi:hypothetical protein